MAFVSTLSTIAPGIHATAAQSTFVIPVGYDDSDGRIYRLFATFSVVPGGDVDFSFCLVCNHKDGTSYDFWDSQVIATLIPPHDRAQILDLLVLVVRNILAQQRFPEVVMHAFLPNLPLKALVKFFKIEQEFRNVGYAISRSVTPSGYSSWRFSLAPATP